MKSIPEQFTAILAENITSVAGHREERHNRETALLRELLVTGNICRRSQGGTSSYPQKPPHYGPPDGTTTMFDPADRDGAPYSEHGTPPGKFVVELNT